jgi:hypothetical protein
MRKVAVWASIMALGALLASALPDIRRIIRIRRM